MISQGENLRTFPTSVGKILTKKYKHKKVLPKTFDLNGGDMTGLCPQIQKLGLQN